MSDAFYALHEESKFQSLVRLGIACRARYGSSKWHVQCPETVVGTRRGDLRITGYNV